MGPGLALFFAIAAPVARAEPAAAGPAAADAPDAGLPPQVRAVVDAAAASGLPTEPLELKAREGLAKGVAPERVEAVVHHLVDSLAHARRILPGSAAPELVSAAEAVRAGASDEAIARVASVGPQLRRASLQSLGDLLRVGVGEAESVRLVTSAGRHGEEGLTALSTAVASLVSAGASPHQAARAVGLAVAEGRAPLSAIPTETRGPLEQLPEPAQGAGPPDAGPPTDPGWQGQRRGGRS